MSNETGIANVRGRVSEMNLHGLRLAMFSKIERDLSVATEWGASAGVARIVGSLTDSQQEALSASAPLLWTLRWQDWSDVQQALSVAPSRVQREVPTFALSLAVLIHTRESLIRDELTAMIDLRLRAPSVVRHLLDISELDLVRVASGSAVFVSRWGLAGWQVVKGALDRGDDRERLTDACMHAEALECVPAATDRMRRM